MHIPDGFVPPQLCIVGYGLSGFVTWQCLRQINRHSDPTTQMPKAAMLAAAFFVASSIQIPLPPVSLHLVLSGLLGAVLGYHAFLAILIGLFFQALFLGHGGFSTLGVNAIIIGVPALTAHGVFQLRRWLPQSLKPSLRYGVSGFLAGAIGMLLAVTFFISILIFAVPVGFDVATERAALLTLGLAHGPLVIVEGIFTALIVTFLQRTKPELLTGLVMPSTRHNQSVRPSGEQLCD
ncbi:abc-type co2+ transport permease component [Leptolyngbya sp. Heron Island J]|uniref:cobalt transporter CbiM n=1 Tax=Leptolyngbya sp. Heron Island J TaxID=1385935 RepID=UPI0003B9A5DA|nr:cobalt transporter CbiM [Leptolyngbya sp. Heron Island J]ESA35015.1 abc-type co2+ transport permease component [Leptolyngbya sp. Heron Island J]